ncbi:MAG: UDP-N-acetylmuramoyl-L-alanine--D-glutamate ligase [Acidimicrobiales bacterium]
MTAAVIVGLGVTGIAVAERLLSRGVEITVIEDHPRPEHDDLIAGWGARLVPAPSATELADTLPGADVLLPSPGVPHSHPTFEVAQQVGVQVASEFDLARRWDDRPVVAVTGTDGKTTVTTMITEMLVADGRPAVAAGNTDVPLVTAIDDPATEVFVVEASSFRLGHTCRFNPAVAAWLNWGPDHLDVHRDLEQYQLAKARIWSDLEPNAVAVANAGDPVVMGHTPAGARTFSASVEADYRLAGDVLMGPDGVLLATSDLARSLPHDIENALASWACADAQGVSAQAVTSVLTSFAGLPHRVATVAQLEGITYVDDSKATVPHAVVAAARSFERVVLIAGGRNKGIDLGPMAAAADHIRSVVAIGDARDEVANAFAGVRPVVFADDMDQAVALARQAALPGDVVLLSPGCASFDWYSGYGARGDDFVRAVRALEDA